MAEVAECEALEAQEEQDLMEQDLIDIYDEYEYDPTQQPEPQLDPTHRTPLPHHAPSSRRRSRGH